MSEYSKEFLDLLESVTAKRPRTVIQHILQHGYITSQELKDLYGYNHPPRAVRDVREYGIPLVTYRVTGIDGRKIAAYKFGNPEDAKNALSKAAGRTVLSKALKQALIEKYGAKCFIYLEEMDEAKLQVDHRIPYEIGGSMMSKILIILCSLALLQIGQSPGPANIAKIGMQKMSIFDAYVFGHIRKTMIMLLENQRK